MQLDESIEFVNVTYRCVHSEFAFQNGQMKKRDAKSMKFGCPFRIYISYNRLFEKFVIHECTLSHDHDVSKEIFFLVYPKNRKLNEDDEKMMIEDMKTDPNPRLLIDKYQNKTGKTILMKDFHNLKHREATKNVDVPKKVLEISKEFMAGHGNTIEIVKDHETSIIKILYIQSNYGKFLFEKFPRVIQVDGTYKTNLSKYSLYLIVSLDMCLKTRIIAAALVRNEDTQSLGEFFEIFKKYNPRHSEIEKIVCDKDYSQIRAIEEHLSQARIILCYFHNLAAIESHIEEPFARKNQILDIVRGLSITPHETEFNSLLSKLENMSSEKFWNYFSKNWLEIKEQWAGYSINFDSCYGSNTNGRIEGKNRALKLILKSNDKLDTFLQKYLIFIAQDSSESSFSIFREKLTVATTPNPHKILCYIQVKYCHELYLKCVAESKCTSQRFLKNAEGNFVFDDDVSCEFVYDPKKQECNCRFFKHYGLPCRHIFQLSTKNLINFDNFDDTFILQNQKAIQIPASKSKRMKINTM